MLAEIVVGSVSHGVLEARRMSSSDSEIIYKFCNDLRRAYFAEKQPFEILTIRRNVILTLVSEMDIYHDFE